MAKKKTKTIDLVDTGVLQEVTMTPDSVEIVTNTKATGANTIKPKRTPKSKSVSDTAPNKTPTNEAYESRVASLIASLKAISPIGDVDATLSSLTSYLTSKDSSVFSHTLTYCEKELASPNPSAVKWGVVINALRDAIKRHSN